MATKTTAWHPGTVVSATVGFPTSEYQARLARAQVQMARAGISALMLSTEADFRYFTGYLTRFWQSPTRPWYLIVPVCGDPVAVIPTIGLALMQRTWISDIRTWLSPAPADDGVTLLGETLAELTGHGGRVGVPMGPQTHLRMPLLDWNLLVETRKDLIFTGDDQIVDRLRSIKSEAEIGKIRSACEIANRAFARVPEIASPGVPLDLVFRRFQMLCLEEGADWVPYLAGASERGGYHDVISPAGPEPLQQGDVLMLDTGLVLDGYFCDFDRNFSIGRPSRIVCGAYERLIDAVDAAAAMAIPGATAADLFHAMDAITGAGPEAGRLGHGVGMQLTEGLSIIPTDHTPLEPGMVLALEPGIQVSSGKIMVHEENIVVRDTFCEFLSNRSGRDIVVLGADR